MSNLRFQLIVGTLLLAAVVPGRSENGGSVPLYRVTVVQGTARAVNYSYLTGSTKINLRGTILLPKTTGVVRVENRAGATRVTAELKDLPPASMFGPAYLTYVLWAISPEGRANNLGELVLDGDKSELTATVQMQAFALIVTAEPYFAVTQPSNIVVMENEVRKDTAGKVQLIDAKYELLQRGQYTLNMAPADLQPRQFDPKVPFELYQARNAVRIAEAMGADRYATDTYKRAEQSLQQAEEFQKHRHWYSTKKRQVAESSRQAIQTAEDARLIAIKRQEEERLTMERQQSADEIARSKAQADEEANRRAAAETAQIEAETARTNAEAQTAVALTEAGQARAAAQDAEKEKTALRAQLKQQLNVILETRDTARGLIVNMPNALFEYNKYDLKPPVREKLAKIAGIVLGHPGLNLTVEGHTDNVGSEGYNQTLSEKRAAAVRDYLVGQGLAANSISSLGFGKTKPIASNETNEGRQKNRRVEIIVSGEIIGSNINAATTPQ